MSEHEKKLDGDGPGVRVKEVEWRIQPSLEVEKRAIMNTPGFSAADYNALRLVRHGAYPSPGCDDYAFDCEYNGGCRRLIVFSFDIADWLNRRDLSFPSVIDDHFEIVQDWLRAAFWRLSAEDKELPVRKFVKPRRVHR